MKPRDQQEDRVIDANHETPQTPQPSWVKTAARAVLLVIIILVVTEVAIRVVYYQIRGMNTLGTVQAIHKLSRKLQEIVAQRDEDQLRKSLPARTGTAIYEDDGKDLLSHFKNIYEESFAGLVRETREMGAKFILVYIPHYAPDPPSDDDVRVWNVYRAFYRDLSTKYSTEFVDCSEIFTKNPGQTVYLVPENPHPSRYGNQLVSDKIAEYVVRFTDHRSKTSYDARPKLLGDLRPQESGIWEYAPTMPYLVTINSQGLRMEHDLTFPKTKQRILFLGDSFIFGPYLYNHHTVPGLLQTRFKDKEFINAGMAGYTITDEVSLFNERAKYCEPDIVVLEASDNDLYDLFSFQRVRFNRKGVKVTPSTEEQEYFQKLRDMEK